MAAAPCRSELPWRDRRLAAASPQHEDGERQQDQVERRNDSLAGSQRDRLDVVTVCTDTKDLRKIRTFLGGLAVQNLACYVDAYGATAEASASVFTLVGMPITYLVGTGNRVEGYITGAAEWLSPAGARLLQFYREQA